MKAALNFILAFFIVIAVGAMTVFAQTTPQHAPGIKIARIDTEALSREGGIPEFIDAVRNFEKEFGQQIAEINTLVEKYKALVQDIKKVHAQTTREILEKKIAEGTDLELEITRRQDDLKPKAEKRRQELIDPVLQKIQLMVKEFAILKGYPIILDSAKVNSSIVTHIEETVDVTADFLAFYRSLPSPPVKSQ